MKTIFSEKTFTFFVNLDNNWKNYLIKIPGIQIIIKI